MLKAIITQLKTGSISNVIPKGNNSAQTTAPYVVVWESAPIPEGGGDNKRGKREYFVSAHFPRGFVNQLDDYMIEAKTLLDGETLTTRDGRKVEIWSTIYISEVIDTNDDETISKERNFLSVGIS